MRTVISSRAEDLFLFIKINLFETLLFFPLPYPPTPLMIGTGANKTTGVATQHHAERKGQGGRGPTKNVVYTNSKFGFGSRWNLPFLEFLRIFFFFVVWGNDNKFFFFGLWFFAFFFFCVFFVCLLLLLITS